MDQPAPLFDTQSSTDRRRLPIDRAGVKGVRYPIVVLDKHNKTQNTIADITMTVDLPHSFRGTHMSRFVEILHEHSRKITIKNLRAILHDMRQRLQAAQAHLEMFFDYFIEKRAPVSSTPGLMCYRCGFFYTAGSQDDFILSVEVPLTTVCPCSKALAEGGGAHNQRSKLTLEVRMSHIVWIEDLVALGEECGSSALFSLLKRADEKFITEQAYANPRFVEDVVREAALRLEAHPHVTWYRVSSENCESIHNHSAYAMIEKWKAGGNRGLA